ncbi:uncharacterized protein KY384_000999 [Bacidia gigantensis]|uniref:uncharacterized protein n=1 Tax=Bacidia gigantensis TaxID=2732470 RepID=UPI001D04A52C|nr:uncharacterized protein KY384_000999 [Bacidia gigantensis]KAG8534155.1 hypothetical protein KY384_000999 [Bacidia gigantensis]
MAETWGGEDATVKEVTDSLGKTQINAEAAQKAREQGWAEPTAFDYEHFNAAQQKQEPGSGPNPIWAANAQKYEWNDEYGDVGPVHEKLEQILFKNDLTMRKGQDYENLANIPVTCESKEKIAPVKKFEDAGLHPVMLRNVELCGYEFPTPIQAYVIPAVIQNYDVIGIAQTGKAVQCKVRSTLTLSGSGKTAAYLIPVLSKLMGKVKKLAAPRPNTAQGWTRDQSVRAEPLVLIIVPTRELAAQIFDEARKLCYRTMLRPCVCYGGAPTVDQMDDLRKGCDVLIGTPDSNTDDDHIYCMFSATFPKEARALAKDYMAKDHVRVRVGRAGSSHKNINQTVIMVEESAKRQAVYDLLLSLEPARTIIFVNNKKAADFLDDFLYNLAMPTTSIHSDRTQIEREDAIRAFKTGKAPILIATGVSARGLDIKNVMHVINYDLPGSEYGGIDEYVHRIGRTARIGNQGQATSFFNERNEDLAESLAKTLMETGSEIPDFLQAYLPEGDLTFDDKSDEEGETEGAGGVKVAGETGGSWGVDATSGSNAGAQGKAPAKEEPAAWGPDGGDASAAVGDAW